MQVVEKNGFRDTEVRMLNSTGLTLVDPHRSVSDTLKEKLERIHQELQLPPVVVFVTVRRKRPQGWSGATRLYVEPRGVICWRRRTYHFAHPVCSVSIRFGVNTGAVQRDRYRAWIGSLDGEGTILALCAHELVHVWNNTRKMGLGEFDVTTMAVRICQKLFPEKYVKDPEEWKVRVSARSPQREGSVAATGGAHGNTKGELPMALSLESPLQDRVDVRIKKAGKGNRPNLIKVFQADPAEVTGVVKAALHASAAVGVSAVVKALSAMSQRK